jgi:hypothetical protein
MTKRKENVRLVYVHVEKILKYIKKKWEKFFCYEVMVSTFNGTNSVERKLHSHQVLCRLEK